MTVSDKRNEWVYASPSSVETVTYNVSQDAMANQANNASMLTRAPSSQEDAAVFF